MRIGFIGLGIMGKAMATNLLQAGYHVQVWNRSPKPVADMVRLGAIPAPSASAAAEGVDILITMLADETAVHEVLIEHGVLDALQPGAVHINMATVAVASARELAEQHQERGLRYIAAPVLGRPDVARAGQLNILAAGDSTALHDVRPILDVLGRKTWPVGERPEQANAVKLAVNTMIAGAIGMMGEGIALTQGYGIPKADFIELITSTIFAAPVYVGYGGAIAEERFEPAGFKLALGLKDLRLTLAAAESARVPMSIASVLRDNHLDSLAHDEGHLDWAALSRVTARRAGQG